MNKNIVKILIFFTAFLITSSAQTDYVKWEKAEINFQIPSQHEEKKNSFKGDNLIETSVNTLTNFYWFFISDVDGDNCSFTPSCSRFFAESVKETNIFQGTLMFFDRFTRDMNFYERDTHYPLSKKGRFFDPPYLYLLDEDKINYLSPASLN